MPRIKPYLPRHSAWRTALLHLSVGLMIASLTALAAQAQTASVNSPDFDEVRELIRAHLAGTTDQDLNRTAVDGLLDNLHGKVRLLTGNETPADAPAIAKATVLEEQIAWLRVGQVTSALPDEISRQTQALARTNKLTGLILDLRFAVGDDYAAAAAAADLFVATAQPLLDWGQGLVKSTDKTNALRWPVVVLVNSETTGAAEALAAVLRETGVALILGGTTRGAAMTSQDFPLKNGQRLRIATSPVKLGDGTAISTKGVKPDIEVVTPAETERDFLDDPYGLTTRTNFSATSTNVAATTNRPARRNRLSEADLVRARRDGLSLDGDFPAGRDAEPEKPVIQDPALARAVDLLKGLAVVRRAKS